ncbi:hypothetical protein B0H34DRAFT_781321 [Crassisporium funariophilum]|nr:hypothetical protein B0H34DRAFT_781321 [Crassisporium funariophilum]
MSQHIQHHHSQQPQYVHYTPPTAHPFTHVAPKDTQRQPAPQQVHQQQSQSQQHQQQPQAQAQQPVAQASGSNAPLVATGDWTKDLVHLAKTAELKKHALTLQLHTAHILSAHATLEQKGKAIQDLREQKNKLESERTRLLNCLREVDLMEASIEKECQDTRAKITQLTDGDYAIAKADVDRLRQELGQPPLPSLQNTLDEKTSQYLNERRLNGNEAQTQSHSQASAPVQARAPVATSATVSNKRSAPASIPHDSQTKRPRGRPKGSKNRSKGAGNDGGSI